MPSDQIIKKQTVWLKVESPTKSPIVVTSNWVTIELATKVTGLSVAGIRGKIRRKQWAAGRHYKKAPDGRIYISIPAYERWIEKGV